MSELSGCNASESEFLIPDGDIAREKRRGARFKHPCGERKKELGLSKAGIFLCGRCARFQCVITGVY
jgi:hypothetical protein